MKLKRIFIISIVLLVILSIGVSSASEDLNETVGDDSSNGDVLENKVNISIDSDDEEGEIHNFTVGDEDVIDIDFDDDVEGTLSVKVNNSDAYLNRQSVDDEDVVYLSLSAPGEKTLNLKQEEDDSLSISLDKLPPALYKVDVTFKMTNAGSITKSFLINLAGENIDDEDEELELEDVYIYHDEESIIAIPQSMLATVKVLINNKEQEIKNNSYIDLSRLDLGNYDILIYDGEQLLYNTTFIIGGVIHGPRDEMTYKSNQFISLTLPDNATGNLTISINEEVVYNQKLTNGTARYSLSSLGIGLYTITARYDGKDYGVDEYDDPLEIRPIVTYPSTMRATENRFMVIEGGDTANGQEVAVYVDGAEEYLIIKFKNGIAEIPLSGLDDEMITLGVEFDVNGLHFDEAYDIDVLSLPYRITGSKNIKMKYNDGTIHKVTVYGSNGKFAEESEYVEVRIGKYVFDTEVGKNGVVSFKIPKSVAPGKYKIRTIYENVQVQSNIVVKHVLKLSKAKIRASSIKIVLKATLKQGKKVLKGKKVTFKFKGKKYKTKTNRKGVAKVTIRGKVLKNLKVGKKVKYQATYLKDTVKVSVKVKK